MGYLKLCRTQVMLCIYKSATQSTTNYQRQMFPNWFLKDGKIRMNWVIFICKVIAVLFLELETHTEYLPLGKSCQFCILFNSVS